MVPKIPKLPVEMRMLTYYNETSNELNNASKLSNFSSSRDSANENSFFKRKTSADSLPNESFVHTNLKNDNVYKPFKHDKANTKESQNGSKENEYDEEIVADKEENKSKNYNSFFMTQVMNLICCLVIF